MAWRCWSGSISLRIIFGCAEYHLCAAVHKWYYAYCREGLDGLEPRMRADRGASKIPLPLQEAILAAKRENPRRSIRQLRLLMESSGRAPRGLLSRSAIHRLLQAHDLSRPRGAASEAVERRAFVAEHAGDLWYGDVMHGPTLLVKRTWRKGQGETVLARNILDN
jgi:putative transposase